MDFQKPEATIFIPDQVDEKIAFQKTTRMAIVAHPDDAEILAYHGIVECIDNPNESFGCVTMTNGSTTPRDFLYADHTDEEMVQVRRGEQRTASIIGKYSFVAQLDYHSKELRDIENQDPSLDLNAIFQEVCPRVVYTHNLADKHDTHMAATIRIINTLRSLPNERKPEAVYGCESWRDLDWMIDKDQIRFDLSRHMNIAQALIAVHDTQITGVKRYDLGVMGRRRAHAVFSDTHGIGNLEAMGYGMDLTPLIMDTSLDIAQYAAQFIQRFSDEVVDRIQRMEIKDAK
jgi:LmbE family N-acetylglucosaminyl deacetylase